MDADNEVYGIEATLPLLHSPGTIMHAMHQAWPLHCTGRKQSSLLYLIGPFFVRAEMPKVVLSSSQDSQATSGHHYGKFAVASAK